MIKAEIICIWGRAEGAYHTLCEKPTVQPLLPNTQRLPESPWFLILHVGQDMNWELCLHASNLQIKGMGSCTDDLKPQGEHRERKGRCWSRCSLVPPSLWAASIVCAPSSLCQAASDPLETWRNLCAIWEMTRRPLHKCLVLSGSSEDSLVLPRTEAHREGSCSNLAWRKVRPIFWPFRKSNKIRSNLFLSEVNLQQNL